MDRSELFKAAHELTRLTIEPGDSYRVTFGAALSAVHGCIDADDVADLLNDARERVREDRAEAIAELLVDDGYHAKVWARGEHVRVYVKRDLSRRRQDMGFVTITTDGAYHCGGLDRQRAGIRNRIAGGLGYRLAA